MIIIGDKVALYIKLGSDYIPLICGRNCELNVQTEMLEKTTASSARVREFLPQYSVWTMTFEGMVNIQTAYYDDVPTTPSYSIDDLIQMQFANTELIARIKVDKGNGGFLIYEGTAYLANNTFSAPTNSASTFNVSLQGSGEMTISAEGYPYELYYGYKDDGSPISAGDLAFASHVTSTGTAAPTLTFGNSTDKYLWIASTISIGVPGVPTRFPRKYDNGTITGTIPGDLFNTPVVASGIRYSITKVPATIAGTVAFI